MSTPVSFLCDDKKIETAETPEKKELLLFQWLTGLEKDLMKTNKVFYQPCFNGCSTRI